MTELNENDGKLNEDIEPELAGHFDLLKRIEPNLEAKVHFRTMIASELAKMQSKSHLQPKVWWKRSIEVPLPLALAMGLLVMAFVGVTQFRNSDGRMNRMVEAPPAKAPMPKEHLENQRQVAYEEPELQMSITSTYLCGVGKLSTETRFKYEEIVR